MLAANTELLVVNNNVLASAKDRQTLCFVVVGVP
jgi:hypothetical protein